MLNWANTVALIVALFSGPMWANAPERSLRPEARAVQTTEPVRFLGGRSLRPHERPTLIAGSGPVLVQTSTSNARFENWLKSFKRRARAQGISERTFNAAFRGVEYLPDVIRRDRNQSEFTKTIWEYLDSAVSDTRIRNGRNALREHARVLDQIEARFGVDKEVVVAVWGLESAYGEVRGSTPIISALSTLAFDGRRGKFFEEQLIAALKIIQNGDVNAQNMTGSWAGAMGHTQFIPTSYLAYAVDFRGDGKRDIWSDDPTDALASTAAYLARFGWVKGRPWGVEVKLPRGFDYSQANRSIKKRPSQWAAIGVRGMDGKPVPDHGSASILLPAGARGAAFMIFKNFDVIERYNTADAYVIGVGHLSDRIGGGPAIQTAWPLGDRSLKFAERKELQLRLTRRGFNTQGVDGRIGPKTVAAIRAFQKSIGVVPDGYASLDILKRLR
ncbi:lytic murein transglycosylase [Parasulfitobacter algicola]|uniref:Lytic murein transglycosylase n=1 Tax=Parasulfitobacter algicola TaxID=2614809 RepID=A0ABX2IMD0_9RHOB|nr:lytic murein transglycosylase [Sulfitobacter algicola]NSX54046.1 lytic murein transglycosylase [Sulfitobacter algicola]